MESSVHIKNILSHIRKLDYEAKLYLMEKLVQQLRVPLKKDKPSHSLLELNGLGSEIWKNIDIDEYVKEQRQWNRQID